MSYRVRPIAEADLGALIELARALGPGMTTLPLDEDALAAKIEASERAFKQRVAGPAQYLLAGEEIESGRLMGVSGVYTDIGRPHGFFSFKVTTLVRQSRFNERSISADILSLANDYTGCTEVGSLAVRPEARGAGLARLLARARYMLMAVAPECFGDRIIAEMRGWQDETGTSPFWDAIGRKFFELDFDEADRLSAVRGADFFADLFPTLPIYAQLLPPAAREAIGRAHDTSARAMAMLLEENFRSERLIDIFDGGPQVVAQRKTIATISAAQRSALKALDAFAAHGALVCATSLDRFRVAAFRRYDQAASALELDHGDDVLASIVRRGQQRN